MSGRAAQLDFTRSLPLRAAGPLRYRHISYASRRIAGDCCAFSGRRGDVMRRGSGGAQGQVGSPVQLAGKRKGERLTPSEPLSQVSAG